MQARVTCRELVGFLDRYLASELPPAQAAEFERHLERCPACVAYLESYRRTIALSRELGAEPDGAAPGAMPEELIRAVFAALGRG